MNSAFAEHTALTLPVEENNLLSEQLQEVEILKEVEIHVSQQPIGQDTIQTTTTKPAVTFSITPSILSGGQGKEFLYTSSYSDKISQLNWDIKNVPIIKLDFTWNISPDLSFNMNGWTTFSKKNVTMNDYDWRDFSNRSLMTDWSNHPNTSLNSANKLDFNFTYWLLQKPHYTIGAILGYEHSQLSWTARGGSYQYGLSDFYGNYISDTAQMYHGSFADNALAIGYRQKFSLYYLGLTAHYRLNQYEFGITAKMSPWVKSSSQDEHYMRDLTIYEKGNDSDFYSVTLNAGYYLSPRIKLFTEMSWNDYRLAHGTVTVKDSDYEGKGGMSSRYYHLGIGAQYIF